MNLITKGSQILMGILSGNPQDEPLHYGEVFGLWSALSVAKGALDGYQVYINHTGDQELKAFLKQVIETSIKPSIKELEEVLLHNDIAVPPTPAERPEADLEQIPVGARFQDAQIAYMVAADIAAGVVASSQGMSQSIREDVGLLYGQMGAKKAKDGAVLLQMMKDKGWLVPPPLHHETKQQ
ncbi:membrane protein [Gottfriedia solisilvae]|uniref:Membrane protein n=2 Tax=Gottfriedia solisilvae TaxID=1516104 RepID=A0A8J3AIB5_9BACI|nr:membrane protein [Gottfriedia solisilvae]